MYTQCPECETTFKLGAEELRKAGGRVRCGDCGAVFNALDYLAEQVSEDISESTAADLTDAVWTSSAANPSGDVAPDLDEYEQTAYTDEDDSPTIDLGDASDHEDDEDEDEDEDGTILYIDDSDEAEYRATSAAGDDPDAIDETEAEAAPDDVEADEDSEFNDSVWDNIPGVGAGLEEGGQDDAAEPDSDADESVDIEDLEFNVPEDKWTNFFGPLPKGQVASVWTPPALKETDSATDENETASEFTDSEAGEWETCGEDNAPDDTEAEISGEVLAAENSDQAPQWPAAEESSGLIKLVPVAAATAAILLVTQLIHYNRDRLAANPTYGEQIRALYGSLGSELYPEWDIKDFEIRGSEAIAGESGADIMDIRAQIANIGEHAAGLPRLRVVLRDRWSNPVAARDFGADEYATGELPGDMLLQPGAVTSAHVSIQDPGAGAQGFELELCLPRRHSGLECTGQPFK